MKLFRELALAVFAIGMLVSTGLAQQITITHSHSAAHQKEWTEWLNRSKERFESQNPDIVIDIMVHPTGREQTEQMILLYGIGNLPDVLEVFPSEHYRLSLEGMFADLNPWMNRDSSLSWDEYFPTGVEAATTIDGHPNAGSRWMLPASLWVTGAALNDDHFAESGLVPPSRLDHHWTWAEFDEAGRKVARFDAEGELSRIGVTFGGSIPPFIHNAGGRLYDRLVDPTETTVNNESVRDAVNFIYNAVSVAGYGRRGGTLANFSNEVQSIHLHGGPNVSPYLRNANVNWEWSFAPFPKSVRGGSENVTIGFAMSAQTEHAEAAWRWMKFLTTEAAADHIATTGRPAAWGPIGREYVTHFTNGTESDRVWIDIIASPDSYNRVVADPSIISALNSYINQAIDGTIPVETALEEAERQVNAMLKDARLTN